ncbi:MAG TPA: uroporphyrinogen-III C-methyltransferase [Caulobacteraceae bacterium]|jgi:uroporphyrin-III C-methyltransferase
MQPEQPKVMLVGAGPASADLLTVRAHKAIETAQAVLYDALVGPEILGLAPRRCLRILTGKRAGGPSMKQGEINALMARLALKGLKVVRLKGGDPSVFGRSGEEKAYLEARGIAVEVVPGVTAASAAAAQFGFPLTHRGEARRLLLLTARIHDGTLDTSGWAEAAADREATLAVYMGRDGAGAIALGLIKLGRDPQTPALAVENAGSPAARLISAPLCRLGEAIEAAAPSGPVLLVIGEVAARAAPQSSLRPSDLGGPPSWVSSFCAMSR